MPTREEIVSQMREALSISEPDLDTTIGTPTRKILDAVAEPIAEAYIDRLLMNYQYDIDSKAGQDLDAFVALFGFTRGEAHRATGTVIFECQQLPTFEIFIPMGTQISTSNRVAFYTTFTSRISIDQTTIEVPITALLGGPEGNVAASTISQWVTPITGINSFSNPASTSGGGSSESDESLRARFKKTVFRSLAGTEDMYLGLALDDKDVTQANVVGSSKRHREQIELSSSLFGINGVSSLVNAKYVYPQNSKYQTHVIFGKEIDSGNILISGVHYLFVPQVPPSIASIDPLLCPAGVYEVEYDYIPTASRNDPTIGITNRVDIYVNGIRPIDAVDTTIWSATNVFTNTITSSNWYTNNYQRPDGTPPVSGNIFIDLSFSPVVSLPTSFVISGITYYLGVHYFLVNDITSQGNAPSSFSGIEWVSTSNGGLQPVDATPFSISYTYNEIPTALQASLQNWKMISTDVQIHQATYLYLNLNLAIIVSPGFSYADVSARLFSELSSLLDTVGFNGALQVSDITTSASNLAGIDAVRFLNSGDDSLYGIQQVYETIQPLAIITVATDRITWNNHGLVAGDRIRFSNTLGTPEISDSHYYYVINPTTNDYQISEQSAGAVLSFNGTVNGTTDVAKVTVQNTYAVNGRVTDVLLGDNQLTKLNRLNLVVKAQNSFGTV